jgi:hypothetical protein
MKELPMKDQQAGLRKHLLELLRGGSAHLTFDQALGGLPAQLQGRRPDGVPFTAWGLLEHLRIAQWDILEFCRNPRHVSPEFPQGYWPSSAAPPNSTSWARSVKAFHRDSKEMEKLVSSPKSDLFRPIPHGQGQTLLREALLVSDHNAYHLGQLVMLRRLLGAWKDAA